MVMVQFNFKECQTNLGENVYLVLDQSCITTCQLVSNKIYPCTYKLSLQSVIMDYFEETFINFNIFAYVICKFIGLDPY